MGDLEFNVHQVEMELGGKQLSIETGKVARQADGAVLVRYQDTVVLVTAVAIKEAKKEVAFLPLTVDYQERFYAAGKIPGGYFKREGRPGEREILSSRLIDRPLRPLFPKEYTQETQVIASVLSADATYSSDLLGIIGASAALLISEIPFTRAVGAVRIGRVNGELVINPGLEELQTSDLNLVVAGTRDAVLMVEAGANEIPEVLMVEAIDLAHREIQKVVELQEKLAAVAGRTKRMVQAAAIDPALVDQVRKAAVGPLQKVLTIANKHERQGAADALRDEIVAALNASEPSVEPKASATVEPKASAIEDRARWIKTAFHQVEQEEMRRMILDRGIRADGRAPAEIRPIRCDVGILPRTHGSAFFTRGETQSLATVTLGTSEDEQRIDALEGESTKAFILHYNFPPYSVGEVRPLRGPGRREIGHGALAERALKPVIPTKDRFPYTLRIVSDILESNGSSSMATVCGATLALMDAGVPIKAPVGGIAMGLIKEGDRVVILSDILGLEDHLGDMDFKVTGTARGITALQMDNKIGGVTKDLMARALDQARVGREYVLSRMLEAIAAPRGDLSVYAPRILTIRIKPDKIREVIGPGGKMIRSIIEQTGVKIDVEDDGTINIASADEAAARRAIDLINQITQEIEVGKIYHGKVKRIMDFGAIVEIRPNVDGLVHISQLDHQRVRNVSDVVSEGDEIDVKVLEVDKSGKIRLSRKEAMAEAGKGPRKE